MISADSLLKTANKVKDSFSRYIVQPVNAFGLGGFVFDIEGDSSLTLSSDITDHYTETNIAIQDHIAIKPKRYTLTTYVGELVHRRDDSTDTVTQNLARKLNIVNSYLPVLTNGAQQAIKLLNQKKKDIQFDGLINNAADIWGTIKNLNPPIPEQQKAYMYFRALQETKQLVSLQTPFEYLTSMAIETIVASQNEETKWVSNFSITLKQIRFASTENVAFDYIKKLDNIADTQRGEVFNGGKAQGVDTPQSSVLNDMYKAYQ